MFADCALRNDFPIDNENDAAIAWYKFVDGVHISLKLPVFIMMFCKTCIYFILLDIIIAMRIIIIRSMHRTHFVCFDI